MDPAAQPSSLSERPYGALAEPSARPVGLRRWLPRRLERQLMLLTSVCLVAVIWGYGAYIAKRQTDVARTTITAQMAALAQNLATIDAHLIIDQDWASIETVAVQTATVPGIYSVLVTDPQGKPISEVVNKAGQWSPRFSTERVAVPAQAQPLIVEQAQGQGQQDFLAGNSGTIAAWHPIEAGKPLGWVRVSYRLDSFDHTARDIWAQALLVVVLAIGGSLLVLHWLLRKPMQALRNATRFAAELHHALGARMQVSTDSTEIEALGQALNVVSQRLLEQHHDLSSQKFALDQHAIVSITDLQGTITYANDRFCAISGYTAAELVGQSHRIVQSGHHPREFFEAMWHTITQGQVWNGEVKNRRKDGSFYWVAATIVPLLGTDGLPRQYIGIRTDITANKELEHSLLQAKTTAEAATVAKSQFLANMSHEIRTPMNAILGMLKLMHGTDLSARQLDYASKAEGAAKSLLGLLNDILDFSKIDAGKMALDPQLFRLDNLMRDLSVIFSANVGAKPVEVLFDIDPATPNALVGDSLRLQQVLINLGGNAIKFTERGEVVIHISVLDRVGDTVQLRFAVKDSGIGIAPEHQAHIFEGFSQAEASTTRRFGGTGLGLSISKRLVEMMGGTLTLESALGLGSTFAFTITLPEGDVAAVPAIGGMPARVPDTMGALDVLVVDDNPVARNLLCAMVRRWGWHADAAADGEEAVALVQARVHAGQPMHQLVLMDWEMPGLDGWETIARTRALLPAGAAYPTTIMVTASGREKLAQRSQKDQAQLSGFLVKPITASMLFDAVADARAGQRNLRSSAREQARTQTRLKGMRLLVVEDNRINQQVAKELLKSAGAEVVLADNGQIGVDKVAQATVPFDAVLMDLQMPVMDGFAATHAIRHTLGNSTLPIIAMTANAMASDRDACLAAGMNDHVGKPFDLGHLTNVLLKHTGRTVTELAPAESTALDTAPAAPKPSAGGAAAPAPANAVVDDAAALQRMGGDQSLYAHAVQAYMAELDTTLADIDRAAQAQDWPLLVRLLHTLKGLSATVGAVAMATITSTVEARAKTADADTDMATQIKLVHAMAKRTQTTLQALLPRYALEPNATTEPALWTPALYAALQTLATQLHQQDMQALEHYAQLGQQHPALQDDHFAALGEALAALDLEHAAALCDAYLREGKEGLAAM
jgi:two-component system, sensor histidine kinase and response regulator